MKPEMPEACEDKMIIRPMNLKDAQSFIAIHHRHNRPPVGHKFSVGLYVNQKLVGVAMAGRPVARMLDDGLTLEVTRVCTDMTKNAISKLLSSVTRAAKAMGYTKCITYTQHDEGGASLRASGWVLAAILQPRNGWDSPSRRRVIIEKESLVKRLRWEFVLHDHAKARDTK